MEKRLQLFARCVKVEEEKMENASMLEARQNFIKLAPVLKGLRNEFEEGDASNKLMKIIGGLQ